MEKVEGKAPAPEAKKETSEKRKSMLFVKSAVSDYVHAKDCNISGDVLDDEDGLEKAIKELLDKACARSKGNNRKTLQKKDL